MRNSPYFQRLWDDRYVYTVYALYTATVLLVAINLDKPQAALRGIYLPQWIVVPAWCVMAYLVFSAGKSLWAERPRKAFADRLEVLIGPRAMSGFAAYMALGLFQGTFTAAKTLMEDLAPFAWDPALATLDAALLGGDPWLLIPHVEPLTRALQLIYFPGWLIALASVNLYVAILAPDDLRRQYLKTYFFCWIVLGNLVALAFLSGGPVYFEALTGSDRFAPLVDYLGFSAGMEWSSVDVSNRLWADHLVGLSELGSGISAFPSLHLAMATLWLLTLRRVWPWAHWPLVGVVVVVEIGSVHLGWHYAIDGFFSIAVTWLAWRVCGAPMPASRPVPQLA